MLILLYLIVIAFLILYPADTAGAALEAMRIWGISIIPTLFPYMVFSRLLSRSLQPLMLPTAPATALLGLLGGSPSGSALIASQCSRLSQGSIYPLCALTGTISPMFFLGTIRSWTGNEQLCRRLLACHWLSALLCAGIVWAITREDAHEHRLIVHDADAASSNPIIQSIDAILQVGGCIILYSVLAGILRKILSALPLLCTFLHAGLEISGGVNAVLRTNLPTEIKHILLSAALGFGGLSILSQNHVMLKPLGIRMYQLLLFAVLRAVFSAMLMALLSLLTPIS